MNETNEEDSAKQESANADLEAVLTPEQIEEKRLVLAIANEMRGTGSYISVADDREVLVRAVLKARPELAPYKPEVPA